jgi:TolA-binding protein
MPGSYPSQNSPQYYERDVVPEWPRRSRPPVQKNDPFAGKRRSTGRRMVRTLVRFTIAVLIGIAGTLAWQSHGEEAKALVRTWAPSLAWLLPTATTSPVDSQASADALVTSTELAQQLKPVALDLAIVRHGVDQLATTIKQLAAKQEEMAQEIATLQATEQEIREKASSSQSRSVAASRKTPQSTGQSSAAQPPSGAPLRLQDGPAQSTR